ncbi:hypothetical protein [Mycoplana dimorpha]|uniref:hypothetical protein n=1 Tax=Mycoplana dimorpha TaxID=28320 RepID=UPI0035BC7C2B
MGTITGMRGEVVREDHSENGLSLGWRQSLSSGSRRAQSGLLGLALGLCLAVAGCQSDGDDLANGLGKTDVRAPSSALDETLGTRGAEITLMIPKGAKGLYDGIARDIRDGAALAVDDLGDEKISVKVIDVSAGSAVVPAAVDAAKARGSVLLVSYATPAVTAAIAAMPVDKRPPLFNLGEHVTGADAYNLGDDEIGSAMEAVRTAVANKHTKVMVFVPGDLGSAEETRLASAIRGAGASIVGTARYQLNDASAAAAVQSAAAQLKEADTVLILGRTVIATTVVGAVKATGRTDIAFIGTSAWPPQAYRVSAANGTLIARSDTDSGKLIATRYQQRYARALTAAASSGYDAIAVAAGLVRTKGEGGVSAANLTSASGFRGVTGLFRLRKDGSVERRYSLGVIEGGDLKPLQASPAAF